jgi:predicted CXXCH cytochrome family protein
MAGQRTQKQIAEKYKGNLDYFRKPHFLRRLRAMVVLLALLSAAAAVVWFLEHGTAAVFSPGPISKNHASFGDDCARCHISLERRMETLSQPDRISAAARQALEHGIPSSPAGRILDRVRRGPDFAALDQACLRCHEGHDVHAPGEGGIALRAYRAGFSQVSTGSCSSCHREHAGSGPMKSPGPEFCAACHNDGVRMEEAAVKVKSPGGESLRGAILRKLDDGMVHFIAPAVERKQPPTFASFEKGHPQFEYEQEGLRDPNPIRYNHARHEAADIPLINGRKLDCATCHQAVGDGTYYGSVNYQVSCASCHSLQIDPRNPELRLPHGDPALGRSFIRSLDFQYEQIGLKKGLRGAELQAFASEQRRELLKRSNTRTGEEFERQIFFTADPYKRGSVAVEGALFPGCAYCHEVKPDAHGGPLIARPVMAGRYLHRGAFSHRSHTQVECATCHAASLSRETSDVLMPPKETCVQCHSAAGGAPTDCFSCHSYHAPPRVGETLRSMLAPREPAKPQP